MQPQFRPDTSQGVSADTGNRDHHSCVVTLPAPDTVSLPAADKLTLPGL